MRQALASTVLSRAGLRSLFGRLFRWSGLLVLNYHRVGDGKATIFDRGLWSSTGDAFVDHVRFCKAHFDVIAPGDLPTVLARGHGRHVLFTFDDGYRDNYDVAFPILRSEHVRATFFVATGFIDSPRVPWWDEIAWMVRTSRKDAAELPRWLRTAVRFDEPDRERAVRTLLRTYKSIRGEVTDAYLNDIAEATGAGRCNQQAGEHSWMTWDMLREMSAGGMTIGGHTVNHPVLSRAPRDVQLQEIEACSRRLATELGEPMRYFSYPVGGSQAFDAVTRECLKRIGVQYAFSSYAGYRRLQDWDDYNIGRVPVESYLTADWFRTILVLPQFFA
jgi:peptidoglycan/xylan/chitin deacetylase (PgdA/CDA1 family)